MQNQNQTYKSYKNIQNKPEMIDIKQKQIYEKINDLDLRIINFNYISKTILFKLQILSPAITHKNIRFYKIRNPIIDLQIISNNQRMSSSLIPDFSEEGQRKYFCYLFILETKLAYIAFALILINAYYIIKIIRQYKRTVSTGRTNLNIKTIHIALFSFSLIYLLSMISSQILFWYQHFEPDRTFSNFNEIYSKYNFVSDIFAYFFFQNILLTISYNWIGNIIQIFQFMLGVQQSKQYTKVQRVLINIIKFCFGVSLLGFFVMVPFAILTDAQSLNFLSEILITIWLFEELIITLIFVVDIFLIRSNKKLKQLLDQDDSKQMIKKYGILAFFLLVRQLWSIVFSIAVLMPVADDNCQISDSTDVMYIVSSTVYLLLSFLVMELILRLFHINPTDLDMRTDSYTDFYSNIEQNRRKTIN